MQVKGSHVIERPREDVWSALNDPDVLKRCIPGCEALAKKGDSEFEADVMAKVGPVKARFKTRITLENVRPPESYTLVGSSKAGTAGFGRGQADVRLAAVDAGTELSYEADFKVGGKLAQVGSRLVAGATRKTADEFFDNLSTLLNPATGPVDEPTLEPETDGSGSRRRPVLPLLAIAVVAAVVAAYLMR